jgi:aryl carrier-like protein
MYQQRYVFLSKITNIPNRFPAELCLYIRDGLRMLSSGPVGLYVPDMKWDVAQHYLGRSPMFEHLVTADDSGAEAKSDQASPKTFILKVLDLAADDFSPEVPLTTYGLDSLSAARLSFQLRSVVQVTQMQLLAHMTLNDIMAKISVAVEEVAAEQGERITTGASQSASSTEMLMQTLVLGTLPPSGSAWRRRIGQGRPHHRIYWWPWLRCSRRPRSDSGCHSDLCAQQAFFFEPALSRREADKGSRAAGFISH